jgi:hypothetical protein
MCDLPSSKLLHALDLLFGPALCLLAFCGPHLTLLVCFLICVTALLHKLFKP